MKLALHNLTPSLLPQRDALRRCLLAFARNLPVDRVILFGSHARNEGFPESDVDLCIVSSAVRSQFDAARSLRRATRNIRPKPAFTLIPISPQRLQEKRDNKDPFFQTIEREGILLAEDRSK